MQHWSPDEPTTPAAVPDLKDGWVAWLSREPDYVTQPEPRGRIAISAVMLMAGVVLFWGGAATLVWGAFA